MHWSRVRHYAKFNFKKCTLSTSVAKWRMSSTHKQYVQTTNTVCIPHPAIYCTYIMAKLKPQETAPAKNYGATSSRALATTRRQFVRQRKLMARTLSLSCCRQTQWTRVRTTASRLRRRIGLPNRKVSYSICPASILRIRPAHFIIRN